MQIRILKSDGTIEPYLHTKVLGIISSRPGTDQQ